ncbi:MAG: hypothetical protein QT10_C0001G0176 [archaeon GW2011_AR19]|nr:MAG: hypothetical protein QT10_C0001G0176 [archaeon GW2011_AR19]
MMRKEQGKLKANKGDDYNVPIWTIFSVAVIALFVNLYHFWTAKDIAEFVKIMQLFFGFVSLVYLALLIEGFSQKKLSCEIELKYKLNYISAEWIFEFFIFLPLLLIYDFSIFNLVNIFPQIKLGIFILMILITTIIIINWIRRNCARVIKKNREKINEVKLPFDKFIYWFLIIILILLLLIILFSLVQMLGFFRILSQTA